MKRAAATYTHLFTTLANQKTTTHIDLSRVQSIQYSNDGTSARLAFVGDKGAFLEILCTPESLDLLVAAWERVRGKAVRMV